MNSESNSESELVPSTGTAEKMLEELYEDRVRTLAQEHLPDAIKTLALLAKKSKSDSVRRLAANDLIIHGHERKGVDPLGGLLEDGKLQIQVNLIEFGSSEHGRDVKRLKSRELKEINPVALLDETDDDDVVELDPSIDLVLTNPGDKR